MLVGTKKRLSDSRTLDIELDDETIKHVSKQKLLGVYIDENLTWSSHIDHLCSIVSSKITLLRQLATYVPTHVQKLYYQGYILPYIDYGSVVWGAASSTNQLLLLCTARTAWSESDQAVWAVHSCNKWWLGPLRSDSVIKLVSVLFGKCTTLVVMKFWPMETRLPCGDQWKAEKLGAF